VDQKAKYKIQFDKVIYRKQIKRHKKKRINKKWAKKYEYRDIIGTYEADVQYLEFDELTLQANCELTNVHLIKIDGKSIR